MTKLLRCIFLVFSVISAFGADPKWLRMPSADFEIFSSASEGDTRRTLQYFERVRNFFEQVMAVGARQKAEPVRVILFGSKKEYEQYRPNEFATAYYVPIGGRDYIVLSSAADDVFPTAIHEYVHLVAQNSGFKLPPWLNEGVAEIFSTLKPSGDKVMVGIPILGRLRALSQEKWVPLSVIVGADRESPYYNEKNKAGSLYNEGWALAHMLELSPRYGPLFGRFLDEIQKGTPSQKAIEAVYGKPLEAVEKDLQAYLRSDTFNTRIAPVKLQTGEKVAAEPAVMFDVNLALLDLANRPGKEAETRARLESLTREDPKRPEPHVALGYLSARNSAQDAALASFETAVELGSRNQQMLWDYGRMAGGSHPAQAIRALKVLLAEQPSRTDVRLVLAQIQMNGKQAKDAIETLDPVKKVLPADAPKLFQILAFANLEAGNRDVARDYARRWIENTEDTNEKVNANRILRYLDDLEASSRRTAVSPTRPVPLPASSRDDPDSAPKLARPTPPPAAGPARDVPKLPSVTGTLAELDCHGPLPKFVLQTEAGRISLLMSDPRNVLISGLRDGTIDMNCGPQKPVAVWIEYDPPPAGEQGLKGIVRAIHYEPEPGKLQLR